MKKNQEEVLIEKISQELGVSNSERNLAYEIFIKKISAALQYDETIKIPNIGLFQRKKGLFLGSVFVPNSALNDTLIFSPFSNNKDNFDFAYFNIKINTKSELNFEFDENIFSLSVNKPIILFDKEGLNPDNPTTSLILLKKAIEEKINSIITQSDFLEGINLWEDFIPTSDENYAFSSDIDTLIEEKSINESDKDFSVLDLTNILSINDNIDDILINERVNGIISKSIPEIIENTKDDIEPELELFAFNNNIEDESVVEGNNVVIDNDDRQDEAETQTYDGLVIDDLFSKGFEDLSFEETNLEKDIFVDMLKEEFNSKADGDLEYEPEPTSANTKNNDSLDWNKELEDELFSGTDEDQEEINLDDIDKIDLVEDTKVIDKDEFKIDEEQIYETEIENTSDSDELIDAGTNKEANLKLLSNEDDNNKLLDSSIDDLFDGLQEEKTIQTPSKKGPLKFSRLILILIIAAILLGAAGVVYYVFFKHSNNSENLHNSKYKTESKKEEIIKPVEEKKIIDSTSIIKTDTLNVDVKEKEISTDLNTKIAPTKENKTNLEPKVETSLNKESIKKDNKVILPADNKVINDKNLYKKTTEDKLITEKIYFDGSKYNIQTSSWQSKSRAEVEVFRLRRKGFNAYIVEVNLSRMGVWYRVKIFDFNSKDEAENYRKQHNL
ncbi:MAG: SPOR domain-containing protein [bacterium]